MYSCPVAGLRLPQAREDALLLHLRSLSHGFICIEPWYGRCDRAGFAGDFREKDWVNALAPGAVFEASYTIVVE